MFSESNSLIRVKDTVENSERFFHYSDESAATSYGHEVAKHLHIKYCLTTTEPDECLCTKSFGQAECELHAYFKEKKEHEEKACPFLGKVLVQLVSPEGTCRHTFLE